MKLNQIGREQLLVCRGGRGGGLVSPDGQSMLHAARLDFPTTNNASEYEALLLGLHKAKALGAKRKIVKSDSAS